MKILLHSILAGPKGVRHPGVHDVPDAEGQHLIDEGYADPVGTGVDTAALKPQEFATLPRPKPAKVIPAAKAPAASAPAPVTPEKK